jgi:two-component system, sensor histidine kinase
MLSGENLKKLREKAEKTISKIKEGDERDDNLGSNLNKLLHELQVHQLEMELQNEELRRVQHLLEIEKSKYNNLFEYSPVGYILMDKNGFITEVNQTLCTFLDLPKQKIITENINTLVKPYSQDTLFFHLRNLVETKKHSSCIISVKHPTNDALWFKMESKISHLDSENEFIIQSSLSDVSDSKNIEDHLLRLSAAFEQSANSIVITDISGNIQYANPRFYETTGYLPEEVIGQNPRIIKHENSEIDYETMWKTISSGNTWTGEFLNKNKFGKVFWEIATITPVKNQAGVIINYLAIKEDITQRKIVEKNLQKAKDFYLRLLEDFPVMVWQCDEAGNFNFFNKTFGIFTGLELKPSENNAFVSQIYEKDRAIFLDIFTKSLESKTPFVVEYRLKDRYDNYRWVLNHARPFTNIEGVYGGFIATCTDMHDRRIVEERLIDSEDKYRRMFEDSSLGIFKLDRSFQFVNANKAFAQMFGYDNTVDFLIDINNHPKQFFPDFTKEKLFRRNLVKSKDNTFFVEKELHRKDGSLIYTVIHLRKVYERSHNKQFYMEGFIEDITNRKLAENQLLVSEQKFKALFEKSYDAILILDKDKVADCNRKASELFLLGYEQLVGKKFSALSADYQYNQEKSTPQIREKIESALTGPAQNFEWLHLRQGKPFDAEVSFARIYVNNKLMVQAIIRDISEKKLVEKQLKQARDDAEKARMAQSEFLSLMSHEIRTPLNAVVSLTDLMLHEEQSSDQNENLVSVKISAKHLLGLIDDILDYNKIESGNIQFEHEDFDIRFLVEQLQKALEIKAQEQGINLFAEVEKDVPQILRADTLRLKQILFNMVSNAIKFTEKGFVSLRVFKVEKTSNKIYFEVKDTGIGISQNRLEAIFEKFTQEKYSTTRKYGGSGLGLTICKHLVELQKGEIFATSKKNEGSVFSFYLPMDEGKKAREPKTKVNAAKEVYSLHGMNILLVEDDKMNQFVAKKVIEKKWSANLTIVGSGEEALNKLSEEPFDLILMDILLPSMDGYQVVKKIRDNEEKKIKNPGLPIIALTADAFVETRKKAFESGMNDFVTKPFDYDSLFKKLQSYMPAKDK